jgi:hypothetical protein
VAPNEGATIQTTNVTITGGGFVTTPAVQLQNGSESYSLLDISLLDATQLLATVPANLPLLSMT